MNLPSYQVRRATVDDLPQLVPLWESVRSTEPGLERRVTEFQVVEGEDSRLLGILGLEPAGRQGKLHTEAFIDFALADELRQLLWARTQSVATNHGLVRIWTLEPAPFWTRHGFHSPTPEEIIKLPLAWDRERPAWLTVTLRDEAEIEKSLDKEFERLRQEAQRETQRALKMSRTLNLLILLFVIVLFVAAILYLLHLRQRHLAPG